MQRGSPAFRGLQSYNDTPGSFVKPELGGDSKPHLWHWPLQPTSDPTLDLYRFVVAQITWWICWLSSWLWIRCWLYCWHCFSQLVWDSDCDLYRFVVARITWWICWLSIILILMILNRMLAPLLTLFFSAGICIDTSTMFSDIPPN